MITERSARRDVATGTEMAGAKNGHCPFCKKPLYLHSSIGDSGRPDSRYCELVALRQLRDGLGRYAMDQSLDFDSGKRQQVLGDLIALARQLRDGEMLTEGGIKP